MSQPVVSKEEAQGVYNATSRMAIVPPLNVFDIGASNRDYRILG